VILRDASGRPMRCGPWGGPAGRMRLRWRFPAIGWCGGMGILPGIGGGWSASGSCCGGRRRLELLAGRGTAEGGVRDERFPVTLAPRACKFLTRSRGGAAFFSPHHAALRASRISLLGPGGGRTQPQRYALRDSDRLAPKAPDPSREIRRTLDGLKKAAPPLALDASAICCLGA